MEADAVRPRQLGQLLDRVDDAVREGRRGADDDDRVGRDGASVACTSARKSSPTGMRTILMLKYCAALSKAAWAVVGTIISGSVMPFSARARSR